MVKKQLEQNRIFNAVSFFDKIKNATICQNEPRFNGFYSKNHLTKIKDGTHLINLNDYKSLETHWIALYRVGQKNTSKTENFLTFPKIAFDCQYFQKIS